ncbi:MAG: LytTR family transcriptional regulator [Flavobacteriia bacterium]|nr:LytTR family transcriptional regulator [Flavobacteriia bacterium]
MNNIPYLEKYFVLIGFGLVTLIVASLHQVASVTLFKKYYDPTKWTVKKNFKLITLIFFLIGWGNIFYIKLIAKDFNISISTIFIFQIYTLVGGIFPVSLSVILLQQYRQLKFNDILVSDFENQILKINDTFENNKELKFLSENGKDFLTILESQLVFIETQGNYLQIYYYSNNLIETKSIRNTLKTIELMFENKNFIQKTHRAFLVNLRQLETYQSNVNGFYLKLKNCDVKIPVSRTYSKNIRSFLTQL